jgi:hypothetical protein
VIGADGSDGAVGQAGTQCVPVAQAAQWRNQIYWWRQKKPMSSR